MKCFELENACYGIRERSIIKGIKDMMTVKQLKEGRKIMKTSLMQKGKTGVKKSLIITLIMVMIITMIPANTFAYTGYPCETDKASAELYPFPVEMESFLHSTFTAVRIIWPARLRNYFKNVPREWYAAICQRAWITII